MLEVRGFLGRFTYPSIGLVGRAWLHWARRWIQSFEMIRSMNIALYTYTVIQLSLSLIIVLQGC